MIRAKVKQVITYKVNLESGLGFITFLEVL